MGVVMTPGGSRNRPDHTMSCVGIQVGEDRLN